MDLVAARAEDPPVKIVPDYADEFRILETHLRAQSYTDRPLQILEAGCGPDGYFRPKELSYEITGVDIDPVAIKARKTLDGGRGQFILGDLRSVELPSDQFDAIFNAFVLEHIDGAELVLMNFVRWLKPGGLLIIRVPDRDSVKGFVTRLTPHWFHVLFYRWVWKQKDAGKPGTTPYPTIYDPVVSQKGLRRFCAEHNLEVMELIGVGAFNIGYGFASQVIRGAVKLAAFLTLGRIHEKFPN
jgi:SAM-dependent methyltransferase